MIYKVRKNFEYSPNGHTPTIFREDTLFEFEPCDSSEHCEPGSMRCKTRLFPDENNGYVFEPDYFKQHFLEVTKKDVPFYDVQHNFLFGHVENVLRKNGLVCQDYIQHRSAKQIYEQAINDALEAIDGSHRMDTDYILAQYNTEKELRKLYRTTLKRLVDEPTPENFEIAKFILENNF